jgi:perosamine synthetase
VALIKVSEPSIDEREVEAVRQVLLSGRLAQGPRVAELESAFAAYIGARHGIAVSSGTAALQIALAAHGVGPGDEVVVPALTFFSTVTAVLHQNAIPVFADIDPDSYCIDADDVERRITSRTRAVLVVHLYGNAADMDALCTLGRERGILIVEDAAQAHGATYRGAKVGSIGDTGCFSFYATKNMTTGEGGIVLTNEEEIADRCRMIRNHGMSDRDTHSILGYNYRMSEIHAAIGIVQLERLEETNAARRRNSQRLLEEVGDIPWLKLPKIEPHVEHAYFWCPVEVIEEELGYPTAELVSKLRVMGVEVRHRYHEPLYRQPLLAERTQPPLSYAHYENAPDYSSLYLPNVERIAGRMIGIPNQPSLSADDLSRVIEVLHSVDGD